jgi:hypothetical protein
MVCVNVTKHLTETNQREERFILAHRFKGISLSWQGRHSKAEQYVSWQSESREREVQEEARETIVLRTLPQ